MSYGYGVSRRRDSMVRFIRILMAVLYTIMALALSGAVILAIIRLMEWIL